MSVEESQTKDVLVTQASLTGSISDKVDTAWKFLDDHRGLADGDVSVDIDALRRKIDWHIVPLMFCCYTMQFLDKVILNVSNSSYPSRVA
jgi:hypothetical protein